MAFLDSSNMPEDERSELFRLLQNQTARERDLIDDQQKNIAALQEQARFAEEARLAAVAALQVWGRCQGGKVHI